MMKKYDKERTQVNFGCSKDKIFSIHEIDKRFISKSFSSEQKTGNPEEK